MTSPRFLPILRPAAWFSGAAFLLFTTALTAQKTGGRWTTFHQWNGTSSGDLLGSAIASAGDIDGDGFADVLIGSPGASPGGLNSAGSAQVFAGVSGTMIAQFDGLAAGDGLGASLSSAGDLNGDGIAELILGAPTASPAGLTEAGSVYVHDGATLALLYQFDGASAGAHLGRSVAGIGDVNGDGTGDFLIGAPRNDPTGFTDCGSVWLYSGADGSLIYQFDGAADGDLLGHCVATGFDINADGTTDMVFGSPGASPNGKAAAGSVLAYSGADGSLIRQWNGNQPGDSFGLSASGIGDINGDGRGDVIIGAPNVVSGAVIPRITGAVYIKSGANGANLRLHEGRDWFENYGWTVAAAGDVNADGAGDYMIGAPLAQTGGMYHGSAYLVDGESGELILQEDGDANFEYMGSAVAGLGDINGVGAGTVTGADLPEFAFGSSHDSGGMGTVIVRGVVPQISADGDSISTAVGGTINFFVDFPVESAGLDFRLLGSQTGLGPLYRQGVYVPLTPGDEVWRYMTEPVAPSWFTNSIGVLDANGDATVTMTVPVDEGPYFLGETFYFSAITLQLPTTPLGSTAAVKVEFLP